MSSDSIQEEAFTDLGDIIEIGDRPIVGWIIPVQACFLDEWSNLSKSEIGWKLTISKEKISKASNDYRKKRLLDKILTMKWDKSPYLKICRACWKKGQTLP